MISVDNEESQTRDLRLMEYVSKNVETKVIKSVLSTNYDILERKEAALREECKELDIVNNSVWALEDKFCSEIWSFSLGHNFNAFFDYYPAVMEVIKPHECKHDTAVQNPVDNINVSKENILAELKRDIDIVKNEITLVRNKNIEENIRNATITLNDLRSLSDEILDILRSISTAENSQNICNIPTHQEPNSTTTSVEFTTAKKLFKRSNIHACVVIGKKATTTVNKIIERPKEVYSCYKVKDKTKLGKFVMKKQSLISLRFERKARKLE